MLQHSAAGLLEEEDVAIPNSPLGPLRIRILRGMADALCPYCLEWGVAPTLANTLGREFMTAFFSCRYALFRPST